MTLGPRRWPAVLLLSLSTACTPQRPGLTVAAAANLTGVFGRIGPDFEARTGIHAVFSFASTAQLTQQIENAAPFDVIAAADAAHVEELERRGLLVPGSRAVYAVGILALWIPPSSNADVAGLKDLTQPAARVIAIANPKLAPYGEAAVETLERLGIWDQVERKIVYAENINMAKQYGASRNADAVFTAYSLVLHEAGKVIKVSEKLHQPLVQELGIVASSKRQDAARKFAEYLLRGPGRKTLAESGYTTPRWRLEELIS